MSKSTSSKTRKVLKNDNSIATKAILDSIADGVFTVDKDWNITSFNRAAEKITKIKSEKAIGQKCFDVFKANICQTSCALQETLKTGKEIINLPINILNHNGRIIPVSISTAVFKDDKGRIIGGVETFRDLSTIEALKKEISRQYSKEDIISKSHQIQSIFEILPNIAESDSTVLIQGDSGTGKELFARAIHNLSHRGKGPFVAVNSGALPENLLESELFGYKKGAFTDAKTDKLGRFALAEGGTLFLDEISDFSTLLQAKLLRVLQEKEYEPLGATTTVKADVRIIAATNRNLSEMVRQKTFREDLFYRLNIVKIELPPLRKRKEDIPLLTDHFIKKMNLKTGKKIKFVSNDIIRMLMLYDFPGNIRELENIIEHAFVMCRGETLELEHLPNELRESVMTASFTKKPSLHDRFKKSEEDIIKDALQRNLGKRSATANELGIHPSTLWRKMKQFGLL
jgi:PAS domain S-box-containing protein